jgi:hypothetical protein
VIEAGVEVVSAGFDESATPIVKLNVPLAVGVPDITPLDADRPSPDGRLPDVIDQA